MVFDVSERTKYPIKDIFKHKNDHKSSFSVIKSDPSSGSTVQHFCQLVYVAHIFHTDIFILFKRISMN